MYRAKDQGRNNFGCYSPRINSHSVEKLALEMGLRYAVERDERREQLDLLAREGCDQFQGYLYQPPLDEVELIRFVRQTNAHSGWSSQSTLPGLPTSMPMRREFRLAGGTAIAHAGGTD